MSTKLELNTADNNLIPEEYERGPLFEITGFEPQGFRTLNGGNFPRLIDKNPGLKKMDSGSRHEKFVTYTHVTSPLQLSDILDIVSRQPLKLSEMIWRQHQITYPSVVFHFLDHAVPKLAGERKPDPDTTYVEFSSGDIQLISSLGEKVDWTHHENIERGVNAALAFAMVKPEIIGSTDRNDVNDPEALIKFTKQFNGLKVNLDALREGFFTILSRNSIDLLVSKGFIPSLAENEDFFADAASWQVMLTSYLNNKEKKDEVYFPYEPRTNELPHPQFLPYAFEAMYGFMQSIPFYIDNGRAFNPNVLKPAVEKLYLIAQNTLKESVTTYGFNKDYAELIREALLSYQPLFISLLQDYRTNPGLLNKRHPTYPSGSWPHVAHWRQRIASYGGRIRSARSRGIRVGRRVEKDDNEF
jgi:hypothetical protein